MISMSDSLTVEDGSFFVVIDGDSSVITTEQSAAIGELENGSGSAMHDPPQIIEVEFDGAEDWTLKELEWKQIAMELMQND
jgi:hypothetical protein